jgi:hypothetical protein
MHRISRHTQGPVALGVLIPAAVVGKMELVVLLDYLCGNMLLGS